jgi:hypothetical protein
MSPPRASNRGFGLAFAVLFAIIAAVVWWFSDAVPVWAIVVAAAFLALALAAPWLLMPLNRLWMAFLGRFVVVNNAVLLGLVYYGILLPTALIMRSIGYDPMGMRAPRTKDSYWQPVGRGTTRETLRDQF